MIRKNCIKVVNNQVVIINGGNSEKFRNKVFLGNFPAFR
jgi:IMP cyclohydrolase